jgi:subtilisin-like proprotein convertase family protein
MNKYLQFSFNFLSIAYQIQKSNRKSAFFLFFIIISLQSHSQGTWNSGTLTGSWSGSLQVGPGSGENTRNITFPVSGLQTNARPVEVRISLNHECIRDVDIKLISPSTYERQLCKDDPNNCDNRTWTNIGFKDDAATGIGSIPNSNVTNTNYVPENWLTDYCENPNGTWTVRVLDDAGGDKGTLTSVTIIFKNPSGDEVTYQTGAGWNGYVYRGGNFDCYRGSLLQSSTGGYNNQNFSQSWADNDLGVPSGTGIAVFRQNSHSVSYRKNSNYTRGFYRILASHDDNLLLNMNGSSTLNGNIAYDFGGSTNRVHTIFLDGSTNMELRFRGTGGPESINWDLCQMNGTYTSPTYPTWNAYAFANNNVSFNAYASWFTTNSTGATLIDNNFSSAIPSNNATGTTVSGYTTGGCTPPTLSASNFSIRYLTTRNFTSNGFWVFSSTSNDDGRRMYIDGTIVPGINNLGDGAASFSSSPVLINSGNRNLIFDFRAGGTPNRANLVECQMDAAGTAGSLGNATAAGTSSWNLYCFNL